MRFKTLEEFYAYCDALEPDEYGCKCDPNYRGRHGIRIGNEYQYAHRFILERKLGRKIRPGYYACHRCNTGSCVNQYHIYEGTPSDNVRDWWNTNPKLMRDIEQRALLIQEEAREILSQVNRLSGNSRDNHGHWHEGPAPSHVILKQLRRKHIQKWNKSLRKINADRKAQGLPRLPKR